MMWNKLRALKNDLGLLGLILLTILIHHAWFFDFSPSAQGDWPYFHIETLKEFLDVPYIWIIHPTVINGITVLLSFYPFNFITGVLASLSAGYEISSRVIFMWPIALISIVSSYILCKSITKSSTAALIGSIVFSFNSYMVLRRTDQLNIITAISFAPLLFFLLFKTVESKKVEVAVIAGLVGFILSFYEFRIFYVVCGLSILYLIYFVVTEKNKTISHIFSATSLTLTTILIPLLLNTYWIYALFSTKFLADNSLFQREIFGDSFLNIAKAITLFHPFWTGKEPAVFKVQPIPFYYFLIPVFSFLGLFLYRKNRKVVFFGLLALIGILLSKQSGQPFPSLYRWLYYHIPGFNAFREATKFYFIICISYSVLISSLAAWLIKNRFKNKVQKTQTIVLLVITASVFLINAFPIATRELGGTFESKTIHSDYFIFKDFIKKQPDFFRTLWVPEESKFSFYTSNKPLLNMHLLETTWKHYYVKQDDDPQLKTTEILSFFSNPQANYMLDASSVKYIVIPLNDETQPLLSTAENNTGEVITQLSKKDYLRRLSIGTKQLVVFENKNYSPHFSQPSTYINTTKYEVTLNKTDTKVDLVFTDPYHPDWRIYYGSPSWVELLVNSKKIEIPAVHEKTKAGFNHFIIEPHVLTGKKTKATVFFYPQIYIYIGGIISLCSFFICLAIISYYRLRHLAKTKI